MGSWPLMALLDGKSALFSLPPPREPKDTQLIMLKLCSNKPCTGKKGETCGGLSRLDVFFKAAGY